MKKQWLITGIESLMFITGCCLVAVYGGFFGVLLGAIILAVIMVLR